MASPRILFISAGYYPIIASTMMILRNAGSEVSLFGPQSNLNDFPVKDVKYFAAPTTSDASVYMPILKEHLDQKGPYDLVILNDDNALRVVRDYMHEPWAAALLPLNLSAIDASILGSKIDFARCMAAWQLPTPEWAIVTCKEDLKAAIEKIGYPILIKPDKESAGAGISVLHSEADIDKAWEVSGYGAPLLAQRFINGKPGGLDGMYYRGKLLGWLSTYKYRVYPEPFGPSAERTIAMHPGTQEIMLKFGEMAGFHGLLGFDWVEDPADGKIYLVELNARPTSSFRLGKFVGIDYGSLMVRALRGESLAKTPAQWRGRKSPVMPMFPQALVRVVRLKKRLELIRVLCSSYFWRDVPWGERALLARQWSFLKKDLFRPWMRIVTAPIGGIRKLIRK